MTQSASRNPDFPDLHVGIIMDGNGRWAARQGLARAEGHRAGALAVHRSIAAAYCFGVDVLTLFAFSEDNWHRPPREVATLLEIFEGRRGGLAPLFEYPAERHRAAGPLATLASQGDRTS